MPVFTSASLLTNVIPGLIHAAGSVVDALESAKSKAAKKTASENQTKDASQLINLFAAYLTAASNGAYSPVVSGAVHPAAPANNPQKGSSSAVSNISASLLPLSVVMAAGPTSAITAAAAALESITRNATLPALKGTSANGGGTAVGSTHAPTGNASALVDAAKRNLTSVKLTDTNVPALTHPVAGTTPPTGVSVPHPAMKKPTTTASELKPVLPGKQGQTPRPAGTTPSTSAPSAMLSSQESAKGEMPVLPLYDVPASSAKAGSDGAAVPAASPLTRAEPAKTAVTRVEPAKAPVSSFSEEMASSHLEAMSASAHTPNVQAAQTTWSGPLLLHVEPLTLGDVAQPALRQEGPPTQSASAIPSVAATGVTAPVDPSVVQAIAPPVAQTSSPETSAPVAEQVSRALVVEANLINRDGQSNFHLRLEPPQLGSVQIHLTAVDHSISARVVVAQDGTRQLLEGQVQHLRQSLADAGLVLSKFDVTYNSGGFTEGGRRQPPEVPQTVPTRIAPPAPVTVAKTIRSVSTHGIDVLA